MENAKVMDQYIKVSELEESMYKAAFLTDSDLQKWDSGCWIRYKLFENVLAGIQTADVVPKELYDTLLKNSIILAAALSKYQTDDMIERQDLDKITEEHEKIGYGKGFRDGYAQAMEEAIKAVGINTWAGSRINQLRPPKFNERRDDEESTKRTD